MIFFDLNHQFPLREEQVIIDAYKTAFSLSVGKNAKPTPWFGQVPPPHESVIGRLLSQGH